MHVFEVAPSARAKCRACGEKIATGELRFGERLPNPYADGENLEMTHWFHPVCAAFRRPAAFIEGLSQTTETVPDREMLEREAALGAAHERLPRVSKAERATSGRAACRHCKEPIAKDAWRISLVYYEDGRFQPSGFVHSACASAYFETAAIMPRVKHFSPALSESDLAEIQREVGASVLS